MLTLEKFSIDVRARFAHQAARQRRACMLAIDAGGEGVRLWNKLNLLKVGEGVARRHVIENHYERHLHPLFA